MGIEEMKFIVDGRQILDLMHGEYKGRVHELTSKQLLGKSEKSSEDLTAEVKDLLNRLGKEIAV